MMLREVLGNMKNKLKRLFYGVNGISWRDLHYYLLVSANRTHEKRQKRVNDNECDSPSETP